MSKSEKNSPDVEVFNRINTLKLKAGAGLQEAPGTLDPEKITNANTVVESMASLYPQEINNMLEALSKDWAEAKALKDDAEKAKSAEKISHLANQIKDLASTFGYHLMEYFGRSLRDYILHIDLTEEAHFVIVQAHIDVMWVAYRENLKDDDGGDAAEELKRVVKRAIEK